ncbi:glycosyltransferase [Empedobacter sp. 189-2]|uniref:glycosyltransferase n=1 Tax=Empedobacter sp. 189-2 TaxID=2746724 RepID=UPI002578F703|nr:glycosyltransferase [Empedobacter sp. 189-2]MDM1541802.1 glycosyltransferase [Empedobacter sp. 189-2]
MKNKKNIMFFVTTLDSGGLENYLLRFLQFKASNFNSIVVFCKGGKGGQLENKFLEIPNVIIKKQALGYFNISQYIDLIKYFKKQETEIVCDFTGNFSGIIVFCAKIAKINKRVTFYRGSSNHFNESLFKLTYNKVVNWLVYKFSTNILSNSKAAFNFFYPKIWENEKRFKVIYNGINSHTLLVEKKNLRREFNIPDSAFVVGHTGRYNSAKNHETIIKVAIELCSKYQNIYFVLCGNQVKDNLSKIVEENKLSNKIILQNNREDIPSILNTLDCYYFPSITEGQPNALIEAMIMGLPIVASNIAPIKESVPDYFHNQLVSPLDNNNAIDKIINIYSNKYDYQIQKWAIDNYNYEKLFNEFFNVLNNN